MKTTLGNKLINASLHVLLVVWIVTSIRVVSTATPVYLWLEGENADDLEYPFHAVLGGGDVSGSRYATIAAGAGGGVLNRQGGLARYRVDVERPGVYSLWARVRWDDGCSNSFFVSIDDPEKKLFIGEDGVYDEWHWVKTGVDYGLGKGTHEVVFSNAEDGVALDRILLTNDADYKPTGMGGTGGFRSDFSRGIASGWRPVTPARWTVADDPLTRRPALVLSGSELGREEYAFASQAVATTRYVVMANVRVDPGEAKRRHYRVVFDYQDTAHHYYADFSEGLCRLVRRGGGEDVELARAAVGGALTDNDYHRVMIERDGASIVVAYDQRDVLSARDREFRRGQVGIGSVYGGVYVGDFQYAPLENIYLASNFYALFNQTAFADDWRPVSGQWWRSHMFEPSFAYGVHSDAEAASVAGEAFWRDYSVRTAVKSRATAGVGVYAYYRDPGHHYLLRAAPVGSEKDYAGRAQLLRVVGGERLVIGESPLELRSDEWVDMKLSVRAGNITAFVDDVPLITAVDSSLTRGRAGLYMDPPEVRRDEPARIRMHEGGLVDAFGLDLLAEPGSDGMGIAFSYRDDANYYLLKFSPKPPVDPTASLLELIRCADGRKTVLASREFAPYLYGRMYYLEARTRPGHATGIFSDKMPFDLDIDGLVPGGFGIYAGRSPEDAYFDDVEVQSVTTAPPSPAERTYHYDFAKPQTAARDLCAWRVASGFWSVSRHHSALVGHRRGRGDAVVWHKNATTDGAVTVEAELQSDAASTPYIIVCGNGVDGTAGYACAVARHDGNAEVTLRRNGAAVASRTFAVGEDELIHVRITKEAARVAVSSREAELIDYTDPAPLAGKRLGFGVGGEMHSPSFFYSVDIR